MGSSAHQLKDYIPCFYPQSIVILGLDGILRSHILIYSQLKESEAVANWVGISGFQAKLILHIDWGAKLSCNYIIGLLSLRSQITVRPFWLAEARICTTL